MMRGLGLFLGVALAQGAAPALADCRQALALGLDVSGSVDAREYRLQLGGLASALDSAAIRGAFLTLPETPVALLVYEWSGPDDPMVILPWTDIRSDADLDAVVARLSSTERRTASPGTALGKAMQLGADYLAERPDCLQHTLDISGDGKSNMGPHPTDVKRSLETSGITINGLVIGADAPALGDLRQAEIGELSSYYRASVILGPDAFVETALGFEDYAAAMARKLERELRTLVFSRLEAPAPPPQ